MKIRSINGRWLIWTTDDIAAWDGPSGDPSIPSGWEHQRLASMQRNLRYGDTFYDIGTEHGWLATVIAREFVGAENMVLVEPSPEMWGSIRKHWEYNGLDGPLAFWSGFVSDESNTELAGGGELLLHWPEAADPTLPEIGGMPYRSLSDAREIPTLTIDDLVRLSGYPPMALNIDVEGAEYLVLKGAWQTLNEHRPLVWLSVHPDLLQSFGHSVSDVLGIMNDAHYEMYLLGTDHEQHYFGRPISEPF